MKKWNVLLLSSLLLFLAGCKNESEPQSYKLENIEFSIEGPLYEGSNSGQYEVEVDASQISGDSKAVDNIKEAKLVSCQIMASDSSDFSNVSSFVLQLTAEKADMTEIAVLNPVNGGTSVELKPSDKDVVVFFQQKKFILLVDASLKKDQEESLKFKGNIVFELKVNK